MRSAKMRATAASLIGIVALVVAACGSSSKAPGTNNTYDFGYSYQKPTKTGGTVIIGDWQSPDSTNVFSTFVDNTVVNAELFSALWDTCIVQMPDISLPNFGWAPSQCTEVPTVANGGESADGHTTTLHLDPKAKWSDGQPIVADDYLFFQQLLKDPNVIGAFAPWDTAVETKVDDHTLKIDWGQAFAPYLPNLTLPPLPYHKYANFGTGVWDATTGKYDTTQAQLLVSDDDFLNHAVVNGPFQPESFSAGDSVIMTPNPNYYSNTLHQTTLDKLIFRVAGTKDVLIQAYKAGQYDHVEDFTSGDVPKFGGIDPKEVLQTPAFAYEHLEFNQRNEAPNAKASGKPSIFADPNIRKAFVESFDRCKAIEAILGVDCNDPAIATNEMTAPIDPAFDKTVAYPAYNPTDGAKILEDAGYKVDGNGVRTYPGTNTEVNVTIATTTGNALRNSFLALMQQQWQGNLQVGVTLDPDKKLFSPFNAGGLLYTGNFDVALFAFTSSNDGDSLTAEVQSDQIPTASLQGGQNYTGLNDPKVDDLLKQGRAEIDNNKRIAIYKQLYAYIAQQNFFAPLYTRPDITLTKTTLGNYKQHPTQAGNEWNIADWFTTSSGQ